MQVTTLSFFRFEGLFARCWAFVSMQLAKGPLRRVEDIGFCKLMGTGTGEGFDPAPNFSVYAILATWPSMDAARAQVEQSPVYRTYRRRAAESWTVYLAPTRARGSWDRQAPFVATPEPEGAGPWVGVLTRATVRLPSLPSFWRTVPPISAIIRSQPGLHFKLGLGELPVLQLSTFSIWQDLPGVQRFAYDPGPHRDAMRLARKHRWFSEELFARFRVLDSSGTWRGSNPLVEGQG